MNKNLVVIEVKPAILRGRRTKQGFNLNKFTRGMRITKQYILFMETISIPSTESLIELNKKLPVFQKV